MPASQEDHKRARDLILQSMSKNLDKEMDEIVKLTTTSYISEGPGREGLKKIFSDAREAFPDAVWTEVFHVVDGNRQVLRYHAKGTHKRDWLGISAKDNVVDLPAIFVIDLNDKGKVVSTEMFMDGLTLTSQMSA